MGQTSARNHQFKEKIQENPFFHQQQQFIQQYPFQFSNIPMQQNQIQLPTPIYQAYSVPFSFQYPTYKQPVQIQTYNYPTKYQPQKNQVFDQVTQSQSYPFNTGSVDGSGYRFSCSSSTLPSVSSNNTQSSQREAKYSPVFIK